MKRYYLIVLTVSVFVIAAGIGTILAGGSSDTSGEGSHCYLFFEKGEPPDAFVQAMVNDSDPDTVLVKAEELVDKYTLEEGYTLALSIGSIEGSNICAPVIQVNTFEEVKEYLLDYPERLFLMSSDVLYEIEAQIADGASFKGNVDMDV